MSEVTTERTPLESMGDIEAKLMDLGALLEGLASFGLQHDGSPVDGDSVERMARLGKRLVDDLIQATQETQFALRS